MGSGRQMRGFSSDPHGPLIGAAHGGRMKAATLSRASLALLLIAILVGGVVLGSAVTAFGQDLLATEAPSATPTALPTPTSARLPDSDANGEELRRLPRYPGSVRTEYEISRDDRYRLTAVEYLTDATVERVRAYYQDVIDDHGWDLADVNYAAGEWTYVLVDGRIEALVEIETWNGLVEIDLQMSEPVSTPSPSPSSSPTPTPEPAAPPPAPPAPSAPSGGDDDDDGDDGNDGDDGDDDDSGGGGTDG